MSNKSPYKQFLDELDSFLSQHPGLKKPTLVVASKYFSTSQILELYEQGQRHFGENRVQDALTKIEALPSDICWHFIGHLQKNKVSKVVDVFDWIHSIDSLELAQKLSEKTSAKQKVLLQLNLSQEKSKSGLTEEEFKSLLAQFEQIENLSTQGLMTMAPHVDEQAQIQRVFHKLNQLKQQYGKTSWKLSMGMSQDYQQALLEGADFIRIGRRLLPSV